MSSGSTQSTGRSGIALMVTNLGVQGILFSTLLTFGAGWLLVQLQNYMLDVVLRSVNHPGVSARLIEVITTLTCVASWVPLVPVLLVALFLPVRLAWIHGRVPFGKLLAETGESIGFGFTTLHVVWRRLFIALLPLLGIGILVNELLISHQSMQLVQILIGASSVGALFVLWRAAGIVSAAPIAILSHCSPMAAAAECELIMKGAQRLKLLLLMVLECGCLAGLGALNYYAAALSPLGYKAATIGVLLLAWFLGILSALVCLRALVIYYHEKQAMKETLQQAQTVYPTAIIRGQKVAVQVDPRQNRQNGNRR